VSPALGTPTNPLGDVISGGPELPCGNSTARARPGNVIAGKINSSAMGRRLHIGHLHSWRAACFNLLLSRHFRSRFCGFRAGFHRKMRAPLVMAADVVHHQLMRLFPGEP
jgi:hypothetical protein